MNRFVAGIEPGSGRPSLARARPKSRRPREFRRSSIIHKAYKYIYPVAVYLRLLNSGNSKMTGPFRKVLQPSDGITSGDEYFMLEPSSRAVKSSKFGDYDTISRSITSSFNEDSHHETEGSNIIKKGWTVGQEIVSCWDKPGNSCALAKKDLQSKSRGFLPTRCLDPHEKSIIVQNATLFSGRVRSTRRKSNSFGVKAKRDGFRSQVTHVDNSISKDCCSPASRKLRITSGKSWIVAMTYLWLCRGPADCAAADLSGLCPSGCACGNNSQVISCDGQLFRVVPTGIPTSAVNLSLAFNNVSHLEQSAFVGLASLRLLNLTGNQIQNIEDTAFQQLRNLQVLDLTDNRIAQVPSKAFLYFEQIKDIRLRRNPIKAIKSWGFQASLTSLDLGELSVLKSVSENAFNDLANLQEIKLDRGMPGFPKLRQLSSVQRVDLSGNNFGVIQKDAFVGLGMLRMLLLSNSRLTRIHGDSFKGLTSLQKLDLSGNQLDTIARGTFDGNPNLTELNLTGNLLRCDCGLKYFTSWLARRPSVCAVSCPRCYSPSTYRGRLVKDVLNTMSCKISPRLNADVGTPVNLPCPTITPSPKTMAQRVMWTLHNGTQVGISVNKFKVRIKVLDSGALNFSKVTLQDKGTYMCSVTTPDGSVANSTIYLNVLGDGLRTSTFTTVTTTVMKPWRPTTPRITPPMKRPTDIPWTPTIRRVVSPGNGLKASPWDISVGSSDQKITQTTNIIIGCFVGIVFIAAMLLIFYYKAKRKDKRGQIVYRAQMPHNRQSLPVKAEVCLRDISQTAAGTHGKSFRPCSENAPCRRFQAESTVAHVLPPPPEEMTNNPKPLLTTTSFVTSQPGSLMSSTRSPSERALVKSIKYTMPPPMEPIRNYVPYNGHSMMTSPALAAEIAGSAYNLWLAKNRTQLSSQTVPRQLSSLEREAKAQTMARSSSQGHIQADADRALVLPNYFQQRPKSHLGTRERDGRAVCGDAMERSRRVMQEYDNAIRGTFEDTLRGRDQCGQDTEGIVLDLRHIPEITGPEELLYGADYLKKLDNPPSSRCATQQDSNRARWRMHHSTQNLSQYSLNVNSQPERGLGYSRMSYCGFASLPKSPSHNDARMLRNAKSQTLESLQAKQSPTNCNHHKGMLKQKETKI